MKDEPIQLEPTGERRARLSRLTLLISIVMLLVNVCGATVFWFSLPEKMKGVVDRAADHEQRLRALESLNSEHAATLGRIDERTKDIQESLADIRSRLRN